jgi:predicted nucleic acid-binding protein
MIAADTSVLIDYFKGIINEQTNKVDEALAFHGLVLPPVVISELLSDPSLSSKFIGYLKEFPLLELREGYWQRAGQTRAILIKKKLKSRLADTLIAQACIDHNIPLITADGDFKHFHQYCGLKLF